MTRINNIMETLVRVTVGAIRLPFSVLALVSTNVEEIFERTEKYLIRTINNPELGTRFSRGAHLKVEEN